MTTGINAHYFFAEKIKTNHTIIIIIIITILLKLI